MGCSRSLTVVRMEMEKLNIEMVAINLGGLKICYNPKAMAINQIYKVLQKHQSGIGKTGVCL